MSNVKLFIDFWNLQLSWNDHVRPDPKSGDRYVRINWRDLPTILISELPPVLGASTEALTYKGTVVYASVNPNPNSKDAPLSRFLHDVLGQMTGYTVKVRDRRARTDHCPHCQADIERIVEKGVDTGIVTDLFAGAINNAYDIAALVSNDSDFVPAISTIQDRLNKQIIHVGFRQGGDHVRTAAWSHILLDGDVSDKLRG